MRQEAHRPQGIGIIAVSAKYLPVKLLRVPEPASAMMIHRRGKHLVSLRVGGHLV
jgi:hypothetical protein